MKVSIALLFFLCSYQLFAQEHRLKDKEISECSGLVCSSLNKNLMWLHNDSGDESIIYSINQKGETIAKYNFNKEVRDCEDIALWNPKNKKSQIFVADIGDNSAKREYITVYQFDEPKIVSSDNEQAINNVKTINLKFPDGARDAECFMFDPIEEKIIIISKRENRVGVYSILLSNLKSNINTLKKDATLYFKGNGATKWITAGDISNDGSKIIVKSYAQVFYWERKKQQSVADALKAPYKLLNYKAEPQGEAIGFTPDAKHFYTISEGKNAMIYKREIN
jgi:hypothetical protein